MWTLETGSSVARLHLAGWSGFVDLNRPWLGFQNQADSSPPMGFNHLLAIDLGFNGDGIVEVPPRDQFVRGTDLVASYPPTRRGQHPQVYWRALVPALAGQESGLELIVSVQTDLLDSDPEIGVSTQLLGAELWSPCDDGGQRFQRLTIDAADKNCQPATPYLLARWPGDAKSLVVMTYPGDGAVTQIVRGDTPDMLRVQHGLLREWLEKGVIRRSRLRAVLVDRSNDQQLARQAYERFGRSELPLTA